ncbi:MAG: bifunctional UDP-N-acetylglucosamine diphosphorylase/glucosamine-1-phosphate N-acetyltransferase GlmU [Anaerolineales bacterium]
MDFAAVLLAAGKGTRMRSNTPKVLHPLLGKPMASYALEAAHQATGSKPVMIIGYEADRVRQALGETADYVIQNPQLGTGHAVQQAEALLKGKVDYVLVTTADMPLVTPETLRDLVEAQQEHSGPISMLTVHAEEARGFGRVVRSASGQVQAIVEEAQATPEELLIQELNPSIYCFSADWLWGAIKRIPLSPKGEYYLTDLVEIAITDGLSVNTIPVDDPVETIGVNTRLHLSEAEALLRERINRGWMLAGVTLIDPRCTYIEPDVVIGMDTVVWPNTYLQGKTQIGEGCEIGPNAILRNSQVGDRCKVLAAVMEQAVLEDDVDIGPFARLRKGAHLAQGVHMGNFGEVKDSYLGPGTKMGHFSYIGNATIGSQVNIGAGTITCNYDGEKKYPTEIGSGVFIGSDTMLVAPLKLGDGSRTGAGSVVTKDVPEDTLVVGIPARAIKKLKKRD